MWILYCFAVDPEPLTADDEPSYMYYVNDGVYGSFNCLLYDHASVTPTLLKVGAWNAQIAAGHDVNFAATCPVGQVRFNFHLPYSNFHLPLKNCMFYNISFKTK